MNAQTDKKQSPCKIEHATLPFLVVTWQPSYLHSFDQMQKPIVYARLDKNK